MKIWEVTTKAYGPDDYDRITAEKDRERKEKQARQDRVRREKEQSARAARNANKQRADVSRAMAGN
jgi:hypothetical protein